jgi:ribose/xylose/arabinose/galactoside ABC-type transport system permease subunit
MIKFKSVPQKVKVTLGIYALLVFVVILFAAVSPSSFSSHHLLNILRQAAPLGIVAIGQTLVLLVGGIDLSVGAVVSLVNVVAASMMMGKDQNILVTVIVTLLLSALIGLVNGITILKVKIPPFLVTLAMSLVIEGGYMVYTKGSPQGNIAQGFRFISDGWVGPIPIAGLIWFGVWGILAFLLYRTVWGRKVYATGGNPQTAFLSGVKTNQVTIATYVLSSLLAGMAGLMISAYIGVASVGVGNMYTMNSIAATVVGGTAFTGGIGGLAGTFAGVLIMSLLQSMLTMMNILEAGKFISTGLVIAIMVAVNQRTSRR